MCRYRYTELQSTARGRQASMDLTGKFEESEARDLPPLNGIYSVSKSEPVRTLMQKL